MSKITQSNTLKLAKPVRGSKFRVYIAEEPGAKLVRHASKNSLLKALNYLAKVTSAVAWEVREFRNGVERMVHVDEVSL